MLVIIAIILLAERITTKARMKGYINTGRFILLLIFMWYAFQFIGIFAAALFTKDENIILAISLLSSILGVYVSFKIVDFLKERIIPVDFDNNLHIDFPYSFNLMKGYIIQVISIVIIAAVFIVKYNFIWLLIPVAALMIYKYTFYKVTFTQSEITLHYLYGTKRIIPCDQIVRLVISNKLMIELSWKKSSRHSTKIVKFSAQSLIGQRYPIENIKDFLNKCKNSNSIDEINNDEN